VTKDNAMTDLNLDAAAKIAQGAFAAGAAVGVTTISVVVTDPGGHIRLAMRGDGVGNFGVSVAHGKCKTALGFANSSMALSKGFTDAGKVAALAAATGGDFLPIGGGVRVKTADGKVIGAAAVAGSSPENDESFILAGLRAAGFETD
jgi:uncharacterized protein GlcG (DUF336 family)